MKTYEFEPRQSFQQVHDLLADLNQGEHKDLIATLTWLEGTHANQTLVFLWDPYAERFGHQIDKSSLDEEVTSSLINLIPVRVEVHAPHYTQGK